MYNRAISMFSDTETFDEAELEALSRSFVEMDALPTEPDLTKVHSAAYLPGK